MQSSHPFRVIDNDGLSIHSMQSLGRVGRILSGSLEPNALSISREQQAQQQQSPLMESPTNNNAEQPSSSNLQPSDSHSQSSNYSLTISRNTMLQEPDVIASTKLSHSKTTDSVRQKLQHHVMTFLFKLKQFLLIINYRLRQLVLHNNQLLRLVVNVTRTVKLHRHQNISQLLEMPH